MSASLESVLQVDTEDILAVVDTNVLLDVFSCHDLVREYQRLGETGALANPAAIYRRARARESMLLTMYFHREGAFTYSLREPLRVMLANVNPDAHDALETHYTKVFVNFVREQVLRGWTACMPTDPESDPRGNSADVALIAYAREHNRPLISNEAFTQDGIQSDKMRRKAKVAGVRVFTPREFYLGHIDEAAEIDDFISRFRKHAPQYIRNHPEPEIIQDTIDTLDGYFRHILLGETKGESAPVPVALS